MNNKYFYTLKKNRPSCRNKTAFTIAWYENL